MSRLIDRGMKLLWAVVLVAGVTAQAPTPPATSSDECPTPARDTRRFLHAPAVAVQAPRGELALVPVTSVATRDRGLMCVVRVPPARGMLFVFPPPDRLQSFWMKNTLVPLDMVFVSAHGDVSSIAARVPATPRGTADSDVARRSGMGMYVIELASGAAARLGIAPGTKLSLPALSAQE